MFVITLGYISQTFCLLNMTSCDPQYDLSHDRINLHIVTQFTIEQEAMAHGSLLWTSQPTLPPPI
jgi:hypothetical protein